MKYYYDFEEEKIIEETIAVSVSFNDNNKICNIIKTEKNLLFFEDMIKDNILHNTRNVSMPGEYNLILKLPLGKFNYSINENNTTIKYEDKTITIMNYSLD